MSQKFSGFGLNVVYKDCNSRLISSITFFSRSWFEKKKIQKFIFVEGNKLIKLKKPDDLNIEEEREFLDDGNTMNLHLRYTLLTPIKAGGV